MSALSQANSPPEDLQYPLDALDLELTYLVDDHGQLSLPDVRSMADRFHPALAASPSHGFTESVYWFRATLPSQTDANWILDIAYPLLNNIDLYEIDGQTIRHSNAGDKQPFSARKIKDRSFAFPIQYHAGQPPLEIFIRVETTSSMQVPIRLWQRNAFFAHDHNEQIVLGLFYGILLAAFFYNLLLAISVRDRVYVLYCLYVLSFALFQSSVNGLGFEYLWPNSDTLAQRATPIFMIMAATSAMIFSSHFLQLKATNPHLYLCYRICLAPFVLSIPFVLHGDYLLLIKTLTLTAIVSGLLLFLSGWIVLFAQGQNAKYFILAWSCFLMGVLTYGLKTWGLIPHSFFSEYAIQIGSAMEVLLLSFAIADRFNRLREDNIRIQREATLTLEHHVEQRTRDLHSTMEKLSAANEKLKDLNTLDGLTGIHNRSYFDTRFQQLCDLAERQQNMLSVMMIDIDHFKKTNDTHGHLVGDQVIVTVATIIADTLKRSTDFLARYGGEEFIVALPATDQQGAMIIAERIRKNVSKEVLRYEDFSIPVTISLGVATSISKEKKNPLSLIGNADKALYRAKKAGRNQAIHWQDNQDSQAAWPAPGKAYGNG